MKLLDDMPNQEHEHEEIANIASTLVGLASYATLHRSGVETTGSAASVQQEAMATAATTNGRLDTVVAVPAARIEAQPRRKLPFVGKAPLKSSNGEAKERKSDVPKTNGAAPVSMLTANQFNAHQDQSAKVEGSIPSPGHFLIAKDRNGGKEAKTKTKKQAKNRSAAQLGTSVLPPSTTHVLHHGTGIVGMDSKVLAVSCQENSKQFLWNAASHFATQGFPQQQGSSAAEPPNKKLRTGGSEKISSPATLLSDESKTVQNIFPYLNGTNGYKPETSSMLNVSKSNGSGLDSILNKTPAVLPHYGQHSAFISGLDYASTIHRSSEMHNAKKVKKISKKEAKKGQLHSKAEPPSFVNRSADPNAKYMTDYKPTYKDEIKHSLDQRHNLKAPPAVNPVYGDWNRNMDSKEKPNKKGNKGKSYSPSVPVVSHPFVPGSFSGHMDNSKETSTNKPSLHPGVPPTSAASDVSKSWNNNDTSKELPVLPNAVKSDQHKDKYSNVQSPNLSHAQQSVKTQGSASNPVTLPADSARDNAALLKVFQELKQGTQPDVKDPKKDYVVRNNMSSNMASQLPNTHSSAEAAYASSAVDNASYNSNQALLAQIMNGNNPSINPDAGNHELALKLLSQHYGASSNNKSDLTKAQGTSLDLGSTGGNVLSQASSEHQQYQELQKQLLFIAQLRSIGASNDRRNGAQAIDNIGADQNASAMALFQQPFATQLLLSQLGFSGNDVSQRSMDNGALQQLLQLQQLQHLQQLLQQVEYQQPSLNDRLRQQQSVQHQQLQQQNYLAAQQQQMLTQVRGPTTPQLSANAPGDGSNVFSTLLAQALLQQQQQQHQGNFSNRPVQATHFAGQVRAPTVAQQELQQLSQQQHSQIPLHLLAALIQKQNPN